ncbi:hypothetical protein VCB98_07755 [Gammaproteobacteria bacterium AB-CW1]|uniref:Thioredoxin domain-containing protein n=1 Tax=Natronospira elongata TaxID=3110268 RepID=A0AAP6MLC8_9GAMM|nr:hypothetical protein [Gammaproteobacteria bacterium AB-CW1]
MSELDPRTRRFRITLVLVFLVCAGPFILAWLWWAFQGPMEPASTTNKGELVHPAQPIDDADLNALAGRAGEGERSVLGDRRWTVIYIAADGCGADCQEVIWATRQIRLSLGRDMGRVRRVLFEPASAADLAHYREAHPDLSVFDLSDSRAGDFLEQFELDDGQAAPETGRLYIVDPLGNLMMYFPAGFDPDDFMDDMKRLLRVSQIG